MPLAPSSSGQINAGWATAARPHRGAPYLVVPPPVITYSTWDPATKNAAITLSGGNLVASAGASLVSCRSTIGKSTGKYYWEITITAEGAASSFLGLCDAGFNNTTFPGNFANSFSTQAGGGGAQIGVTVAHYLGVFVAGNVIGIALDAGLASVWWHVNGVWKTNDPTGAAAAVFNSPVNPIYCCVDPYSATYTANFGASAFSYSVPAGFNSGLF